MLVFVYENSGVYNVSLTATNGNGTDAKFLVEYVEVYHQKMLS
ncbi:hypothetical protein [Methanococcoides sp. AM1]|nr:hypothetical protein [Methanococcoides sp. AM1]